MIDIKLLRDDIKTTEKKLLKRGFVLDTAHFQELDAKRKKLQVRAEELQAERNAQSKAIGAAKAKGKDVQPLMDAVSSLGDELKQAEEQRIEVQQQFDEFLWQIPNIPDDSVPVGSDEKANVEVRKWGEPADFDFEPKDHVDLGMALDLMDFESAAKLSGSRFVVLYGQLAQLQRALIQFMLDVHIFEHAYEEVYVPYLVNDESMFGTGQLPKFADDAFQVTHESGLYLIPTAEVPVTNLLRDEIVDEKYLPYKYVAHTPCFRSEAGAYGKDTRGMIRNHQFEKVELVRFVKPEDSAEALEELTREASCILENLKLPYRVVVLSTGDIGFSSAKTYDLEVWLPSQNCYREISSCSNFKDFQARRAQIRYRPTQGKKPEYLHTLNGSGLAVGRTLVAIMENYQDKEGNIHIPEALQEYMDGLDLITPPSDTTGNL